MSTKKLKASERQAIARKVTTLLKKKYGGSVPKDSRPVLETLLFAACLENAAYETAGTVFETLLESFHDLNEIRVSSISEIEETLAELPEADWKALRIRETLQHVFEEHYSFDLDPLKRKTMDAAEKQLAEVRYLTPFIRLYVLQHCLGCHVTPIDDVSRDVLVWLGLVEVGATQESAAEEMKSALRKQDAPLFLHLVRAVATDPKYAGSFTLSAIERENGAVDATSAPDRLQRHLAKSHRKKAAGKKVTRARKKPAGRKKTGKKTSSRKRSDTGKVTKKVSRPSKKTSKRRVKHK